MAVVDQKNRENFLYKFIGANKSGKTTVAETITREWRKNRGQDYSIVSFDPTRRISDITDFYIDPEDDEWALKCHKLRNCLLFLDEFRLLNDKNVPAKGLKSLLQMHTNYNMDIIAIVHNPGLVLNCFTYHTSKYFIFNTYAQEGSFEKKIPNYHLCLAASEQVNEYVRIFGRGAYPRFPYIAVDINNQKLSAYNMEKKLSNVKIAKPSR